MVRRDQTVGAVAGKSAAYGSALPVTVTTLPLGLEAVTVVGNGLFVA